MKVEEEKLVNDTIICVPNDVHFNRSTQEVRCECNRFKSSNVLCCHCLTVFHSFKVYKVPTCYVLPQWSKIIKRKHTYVKSSHDVGLCAHFFNIAQEFVNNDDERALLYATLEETRAKLTEHRAKKRSKSVADTHTNIGSQSLNVVGVDGDGIPNESLDLGSRRGIMMSTLKIFKDIPVLRHNIPDVRFNKYLDGYFHKQNGWSF
ncbi:hypothetical protein Ahy_A09g043492 [Arachis hypogaea]|uniref:SWIM-type domain-containing protein n=1 Tax=Arachis hypogaea TaxID=3818 RepID=A0A445BIL4_ARAHY|nr:hypothetical protein Ahy_A09g043492 [Arachis hypogaea]